MDNQKLLGVLVLTLVLIIGDIFIFSHRGWTQESAQKVVGEMSFRLEGFGKNVLVDGKVSLPGVKSVYLNGKTLIIGDAERLAKLGVRGKADAYLVSVSSLKGKDKTYLGNVSISATLPITIPKGAVLDFVVLAEVRDGNVSSVIGSYPITEWKNLSFRGRFVGIQRMYRYVVPFENRTGIKNASNVCYNYSGIKNVSYVTYYGPNYFVVTENMTNLSLIRRDFGEGVYCPPTVLITNESLPYNRTVIYKGYIQPVDYFALIPYILDENGTTVLVEGTFNVSGSTLLDWKDLKVKKWS
jgi:hypothetical protein